MKKTIIISAIIIIIGFIAYRAYENIRLKKEAMNQPVPEKIIPVKITTPAYGKIIEKIKAAGNIMAESELTIYSKSPGKILKNLVQMGSAIKPGDIVSTINRDEVGYEYKPYEVKSDVKGVVLKVLQNPGAAINPNTPLMTLVDIDIVKAVAAVDEMKIRFIKIGQPAIVKLQAYPNDLFPAQVTNISPVCNQTNRTIDIEVSIKNPTHKIKPGMYAEVELVENTRQAITLPISSIVERAGQKYVFTIENEYAKALPITIGTILGDSTEILSGLRGNENIIFVGADKLNDKEKVIIIK